MTNQEAIDTLIDMANALHIIRHSKQGVAIAMAIESLKNDDVDVNEMLDLAVDAIKGTTL